MEECIIFTTINDDDLAQQFIGDLLEESLILSATIFSGVRTMYIWEGQMTIDEEFRLMLKARKGNYAAIEKYIMEKHPYQAPEIIKIDAEFGSPDFRQYILSKKQL
ncbi:MAG: divalent-cation tolerance protein CutA [Spirochaetales bacterium]|nr:divalent-cation tolerance protein CutA [Spirochaetales bacterium]